ncbi:CsbD family protein [Tomitella cavernea]|uniref:CsbD-like domain-containing protein n=1 Tax=Tomitella cavernea TaxID=1387982 RepID=A0ABP9C3D1_9ACTN|nr:CsbD family protein [Tomitella cavernea]
MGVQDKFENKAEELKGRAKEAAGAAAGDEDLRNEGQADQASSSVKRGVEKTKDKANEVADKLTGGKDE